MCGRGSKKAPAGRHIGSYYSPVVLQSPSGATPVERVSFCLGLTVFPTVFRPACRPAGALVVSRCLLSSNFIMANTYTQIHLQVVFAVQGRRSLIPALHAQTLYQYIAGIISQQGQKLLAINGMPDHLHLLIGLRPDKALADLMRDVKANSAKFFNEQRWSPSRFSWQEGYGAFSYGMSQLPQVIRYIERQQEHHAKRSFAEEYELLLKHFGVEYNPAYLLLPPKDTA